MTIIKRIFVGTLLAFGAVLLGAVGAWLFVEDATLVSLLVKRLETATDTHISHRDDATISRTWTPEVSVDDLVIAETEGGYRLETSSMRLKVSLPKLLSGRLDIPHLLLGDTRVHFLESAASDTPPADERPDLDLSALRLRPVLRELQIAKLSVFVEGDKYQLPATRVSELSLQQDPAEDIPRLSAQVDVEGEKLHVNATLPDVHRAFKKQQLPFSISVRGIFVDSSAVGQVDFSQPDAVIEAELRVHAPDMEKIPTGIEGFSIPGNLTSST